MKKGESSQGVGMMGMDAQKDVDFIDHGNPKTHPEAPHEHTWK